LFPLTISLDDPSLLDETFLKKIKFFVSPPISDYDNMVHVLDILEEQAGKEVTKRKKLSETATAINFKKAYGFSFEEVLQARKDNKRIELMSYAKKILKPKAKTFRSVLQFINNTYLNEETIHEEQISNNRKNLMSKVKISQGYSGTMEDIETNPHGWRNEMEKDKGGIDKDKWEIALDVGTNGQTIEHLISKNRTIKTTDTSSPKEFLDKLLSTHAQASQFQAVIDVGALFKEYTNEMVAAQFLEYFSSPSQEESLIKGILYYDSKTNMLCCLKKGMAPIELPSTDAQDIEDLTGCKKEQLFAYYDQCHTRGADLKFAPDAQAFMTLGKHTSLEDLLQAAMRMRGLPQSQRIEIVIPQDIHATIIETINKQEDTTTISIEDIVLFCTIKGLEHQQSDNLQAYILMMTNAARSYARDLMYAAPDLQSKTEIFSCCRSFFIRSMEEHLYDKYGGGTEKLEVKDYLDMILTDLLKKAKGVAGKNQTRYEQLEKELLAMKKYAIETKKLPNYVEANFKETRSCESTGEQVAEAEHEIEAEREAEVEVHGGYHGQKTVTIQPAVNRIWEKDRLFGKSMATILNTSPYMRGDKSVTISSICDVMDVHMLSLFKECFSKDILATNNFIETEEGQCNLFGSLKKPVHEMLVIYGTGVEQGKHPPCKMVLLATEEASAIRELLKSNKEKVSVPMALMTSSGVCLESSESWPKDYHEDKHLQELFTEAAIIGCDLSSLQSKEKRPLFQKWAETHPAKKLALFEKILLDESLLDNFSDSQLEKDLNTKIKEQGKPTKASKEEELIFSFQEYGQKTSYDDKLEQVATFTKPLNEYDRSWRKTILLTSLKACFCSKDQKIITDRRKYLLRYLDTIEKKPFQENVDTLQILLSEIINQKQVKDQLFDKTIERLLALSQHCENREQALKILKYLFIQVKNSVKKNMYSHNSVVPIWEKMFSIMKSVENRGDAELSKELIVFWEKTRKQIFVDYWGGYHDTIEVHPLVDIRLVMKLLTSKDIIPKNVPIDKYLAFFVKKYGKKNARGWIDSKSLSQKIEELKEITSKTEKLKSLKNLYRNMQEDLCYDKLSKELQEKIENTFKEHLSKEEKVMLFTGTPTLTS